jgi:surface protein
MIVHDSNVLKFNGFWLGYTTPPTIYRVTVGESQHGTIYVNPTEGPTGTLVSILAVPDSGYELDTISLTGAVLLSGNQFFINGSDVTVNATFTAVDYNPLNLPPYTIRIRCTDGVIPDLKWSGIQYSRVPGTTDVFDITYNNSDWGSLLVNLTNDLLEILGGNLVGVTKVDYLCAFCEALTSVAIMDTSTITHFGGMFYFCKGLTSVHKFNTSSGTDVRGMFFRCESLTSVPQFNLSNVTLGYTMFGGCYSLQTVPLLDTSKFTSMLDMFSECHSLTRIPLFNTSKVTDMDGTFDHCYKVQSGALALYKQASSQANPPSTHERTFRDCGKDTVSGAAELAQIPAEWKTVY